MALRTLLSLLTLAVACTSALDVRHIKSSRAPSTLPIELSEPDFVLSLTEKVARPASQKRVLHKLYGRGHSTKGSLAGVDDDEVYVTDITIGGQNFKVIFDTGSSDTWVIAKGFSCFALDSTPQDPSQCFFGSDGFDPSKSKTFLPFLNTNFNATYGDGTHVTGTIGFDEVTVAGLTVKNQEIGIVTQAFDHGDSVSSGILGLAYPALTSAFMGDDPNMDADDSLLPYSPFFFSAVQQGLVGKPIFSVALNRASFAEQTNSTFTPNLGYVAFGGVAPVPVTNTTVTVPVQGLVASDGSTELVFYTVDIDKLIFPSSESLNTTIQAFLDTGTTLTNLPTHIAQAFNAQFQPPGKFSDDFGVFVVDCDARAPPFSVVIGSVEFTVDPRDLILPSLDANGNVLCASGVNDGGSPDDGNVFVLGDTFMRNVVVTFNIQVNNITLSQRVEYH